ncbi:AI-2E family transporter [Haliangium ochraceum]|uniref:AI-2E family transporter n=1 Tax=Haliangium ochraceum (strain DSM 14365 / JCM 11303 / SMP-2) TaxID=502025 RepID=D0LYG9_HALO1|nr:AI-2E family transporter [Haliangium ochraceum]ACY17835.1 protein of unknown function UPF0118 [Haliangium ochraceum DSM 14365]
MSESKEPSLAHRAFVASSVAGAVVVAYLAIGYLSQVVLVIFAGVLLAVFLDGLTRLLCRHTPLPRWLSLTLVCLGLVALFALAGWQSGEKIGAQVRELSERIPVALERLRSWVDGYDWAQPVVTQFDKPTEVMSKVAPGADMIGRITGVFSVVLGAATNIFIVLFLGIYLAASPGLYVGGVAWLAPAPKRERTRQVLAQLGRALRRWLGGRFASMAVVGVFTAVGLLIAGVPLAFILGVIAGALSFIPYIGPILSVVPGLLMALTIGPQTVLFALMVYFAAQLLESYLITPLIQRRVVSMPPAVLIMAQMIMGVVAGLLGVLLATPLAVVVIVLVQMLYLQDVRGEDITVIGGEPAKGDDEGAV